MNTEWKNRKIIFFDGVCGLCNGFVDFVMKHDRDGKFLFSPLQSEFARTLLPPAQTEDLKTMVVYSQGQTFQKAAGVFKVAEELGGIWRSIAPLKYLPNALLDWGYDMMASNRYRLFGKKELCRLPTPEERQRFLL